MKTIIVFIMLAFTPSIPTAKESVAIRPREIELRFIEIKKSRGKGKGSRPYFAKYL